ncbi:hypothetical protein AOL_s00007g163 [Orbilia oligospora ATCC 24927]|uniref:Uncharacterized protein n=2 Tax=Orbilia oligospora TaxID=2813651 RepID=G1X1K4_ARTOA|nr:hypothetical protein AOL_s00007g163 [Orbilia oligospora ATCC 24927]EGX52827.1 hypothetical protein AOL_s00007g163 [Orbilia oligospora ATCC 24927]KAF3287632.1 hypothetical protein TWF970_007342 [Orbilia oligospora]
MIPATEEILGNDNAAQDLYGTGVRVGLYLQSSGLALYNYSSDKHSRQGLKIASGSICIAILSPWFVFAAQQAFSPCEAFIVLLMLSSLFPPGSTLRNIDDAVGQQILGLVAILLSTLGISLAFIWTFGKLVVTLPELGTKNVVFFCTRVSLKGWFRWLALTYFSIDAITTLFFSFKLVKLIKLSWTFRSHGDLKLHTEKWFPKLEGLDRAIQWAVRVWVITMIELTIRWNHLEPASDFRAPGQLIPLISGIFIFIDSLLAADFKSMARSTVKALTPVLEYLKGIQFPKIPRKKLYFPSRGRPKEQQGLDNTPVIA